MKFDAQIEILQRFGRLSGAQKRAVTSEDVARAQGVKANTAALNNGFFVEAGWLERAGRGQYVATDTLWCYVQRIQFDPSKAKTAATLLAETIRKSWYWQVLEGQVQAGGLPRTEALVLLSSEAGAGQEYKLQLENVLHWLQFVGLVRLEETSVLPMNDCSTHETQSTECAQTNTSSEVSEVRPTQQMHDQPAHRQDAVLAFDVNLVVTLDDLAALSPDQIRALFDAVGVVASLTKRD
ncbi:MAG: hypothetical protein JXA67_11080 [Micromonosporaceae bacterium]|nr:hypothetical protein [Micromonosporaceae bacterium]